MAKVIRAARHAIALDASLHVNTTQATPPYPRECASSLTHLPSIEHQSRQRLLGLRVGEAHDEITRQRVALDVVAKFENVTYIGLGAAAPATTGRPWRTPTLPTARPRSQGSPNYSLLRLFFRVPRKVARAARGARRAPEGWRVAPRSGAGCRAAARSAAAGG